MNLLKLTFFTLLVAFLFSCSKINSVSIDSPPESVFKGSSVQLKAVVKGEGSPDTTLNWVIVEPVEKGTSITKEGLLTISTDETAKYVTIKAITVGDTSKYAVSNIKLILDPKLFYGKWECKRDNFIQKITIDSSTWSSKYSDTSDSYKIENLEWTPVLNEDLGTSKSYPEGYIIVGKATAKGNITNVKTGQIKSFHLYLNKEKNIFYRTADDDPSNKYYYNKVN